MTQVKYRIRVEGELDKMWSDWFGGVAITYERTSNGSPVTLLIGCLDQAALRGILSKILDLNLTLLSVVRTPLKERAES